MAKILQQGENPNVQTGAANGAYLNISRRYLLAVFPGTVNPNSITSSPTTKINILDTLPTYGQRWPRRYER